MKYIIEKARGAFYAGSEKIAQKGLKLRRYLNLNSVKKMVGSLHLKASQLVFLHVSRNEQKKLLSQKAKAKARKMAKKKGKAKRRKR